MGSFPRRNQRQWLCKIFSVNKVHYGLYATYTSAIMYLICPPPLPPPKFLNNLCFPFLLGITAVPIDTENNACAKLWGANKVHDGLRLSHNLLGNFSASFDFFSILNLFFPFFATCFSFRKRSQL